METLFSIVSLTIFNYNETMNEIETREMVESDVPLFQKWLYLPHVAKWYHDQEDWLEEVSGKEEFDFIKHFIIENDGHPIGFCQYYEYVKGGEIWQGDINTDGIYSIDYLIGETEYLGKGYGKKAIALLIEKIMPLPGAKGIIVQPETENKASCNTLLSCGFRYDAKNDIFIMAFK